MINMQQILAETNIRWLRPTEICEILRNYHNFYITPDPPCMPPGGSLFLFDRKALRYFRKDGHRWRKKKDGKTVREAHEKLKSGNVDVLHCYYAHGEGNENFQRRCYWLLDGKLEHIVLVHYRDLSEEASSSMPQSFNTGSTLQEPMSSTGVPVVATPANNASVLFSMLPGTICQPCADSSLNTNLTHLKEHNFSLQQLSRIDARRTGIIGSKEQTDERIKLELHDDNNATPDLYLQPLGVANAMDTQVKEENIVDGIHPMEKDGMNDNEPVQSCDKPHNYQLDLAPSSASKDLLEHQTEVSSICKSLLQNCIYSSEFEAKSDANERLEHQTDVPSVSENLLSRDECNDELVSPSDSNERLEPKTIGPSSLKRPRVVYDYEARDLEKLDSFGRWMNKELSKDSNESLIALSSCSYWNTIDMHNDDKVDSSLSRHTLLDVDTVTPSLSREQLFSIQDFSPDWAYSEVETKVLIVGKFLGGIQPGSINWCCMFGEIEVSAEVLTTNAIRCQAPPHSPGRVPFYITCSNRLACSEIRDFEYRENPPGNSFSVCIPPTKSEDEMHLKERFLKMLFSGSDKEKLSSVESCENCKIKKKLAHMLIDDGVVLENTEIEIKNNQNQFCEKSLKQQIYEWFGCKMQDDKGVNSLNDEGQGVTHLAATLGIEWAMTTLVIAGDLSFRDARGRIALHWAAFYRRDEIIVALLKLGASSGTNEDPTSKFLGGQTASDLASRRGHKGIAGYLAEADLIDNLKLMSLFGKAAEAVANIIKGKIMYFGAETWQISLRESLATVKNSVQAAAQIRAAFRVQSFCQQQSGTNAETSEISCEVMPCPSLNL